MNIKSIKLTNYRNHTAANHEFAPGINVITGLNGAGKTNILEAIHLLSTTKSFRAKYDRDLISYSSLFSRVEANIDSNSGEDNIELQLLKSKDEGNTSSKKVKINGTTKTLKRFIQLLNTVLFSPEDIDIITGAPSNRRKYLNLILFQVNQKYKQAHLSYTKVVIRRNRLLSAIREGKSTTDQLPYWNSKLLEFGEYIQQERSKLFEELTSYLGREDSSYASYAKNLAVEYKINSVDTQRLHEYKNKEILAKTTLIGPHRDDFIITQNGKAMSEFASRGEQRTAMFILKLFEINYINSQLHVNPILLLDDIFSELDPKRKKDIISLIKKQQTIITTTDINELPALHIDKKIEI